VDWIQLREKDLCGRESLHLAHPLTSHSRPAPHTAFLSRPRRRRSRRRSGCVHLSENVFRSGRRALARFEQDSVNASISSSAFLSLLVGSWRCARRCGLYLLQPDFSHPSKAFYGRRKASNACADLPRRFHPVIAIGASRSKCCSCYAPERRSGRHSAFQESADLPHGPRDALALSPLQASFPSLYVNGVSVEPKRVCV